MAKNLLTSVGNTKTRTFVIFLGVLLIIALAVVYFRSSSKIDPLEGKTSSTAAIPSSIKAVPGNETAEKYRELQMQDNRQRVLEAYQKKTSAIPTIIGAVSTKDLSDKSDDLLNGKKGNDINDTFGDTQRGGFIGKGAFNPKTQITSGAQARDDKVERERERVRQIKEDQQRQKELDRTRKTAAEEQARYVESIKQTATAMQKHAASVFGTWTKINEQAFMEGAIAKAEATGLNAKGGPLVLAPNGANGANGSGTGPNGEKKEYIKAGSVLFGVIETAINTDEPGPIMATIVSGRYKGGKLLGKVDHPKQAEKAVLTFTVLSLPKHDQSIKVSAVAIDPDTARTALASDVDHHYLLRYGSLFASAFMSGYGKAISEQGSTTISSPTGTITSTKADLSGQDQVYAALGEVGKQWSKQAEKVFDTPYTVKIDQGVGVGVLFLQDVDVTLSEAAPPENTSSPLPATVASSTQTTTQQTTTQSISNPPKK